MKKNYLILLILVLLVAAVSLVYKSRSNNPVSGNHSREGKKYERLISLAPSITETLFALGLGEKVVGVTRFCRYPPKAKEKAVLGGFLDTNYEAIATLEPDLVLVLPEHEEVRNFLAEFGLECLVVHNRKVDQIIGTIKAIGVKCGAPERAEELAGEINSRIAAIKGLTGNLTRPRVLIAIGRTLGSGSIEDIHIAGPDTFYDELITFAGGKNAYASGHIAFPVLSAEGLIHLNPEVIIELVPDLETSGVQKEKVVAEWEEIPGVDAVRQARIHLLGGDRTVVPGPRFILLLEDLARVIHPEAFK